MKIAVELPGITIVPQAVRKWKVCSGSLLARFEEGLTEAKKMKEGKLPKKPLCELYENR